MSVKKNVPEIRFKGFSGEWVNAALSDVIDVRSGKDYKHLGKGSISVYGTGGYMLSVDSALSNDEDAIGIGRKGTIDKPYLLRAPFWTVDTLFYAVPRQKFKLDYLFCLFQKIDWKKYDESTGVPSLSKVAINNIQVRVTNESEQAQIGNTFQKLDNLINQHQQKHDKLSNIKKAMLEKMFPKPGETTPEIRFKGFSGEWESNTLGGIALFYKGKGLPKSSIQDDGVYSCIHYGELFTKYSEVIDVAVSRTNQNDNFFSISNDVLMPTSDVTPKGLVKSCCVKQSGIVLGGDILVIRPNNKNIIDGAFLSRFIRSREKQVLQNVTGSTVFHLYASSIEDLDIYFPSIEEQTAIGNYFQKLDSLINQHQQQINKLNNVKQACLSKMFV